MGAVVVVDVTVTPVLSVKAPGEKVTLVVSSDTDPPEELTEAVVFAPDPEQGVESPPVHWPTWQVFPVTHWFPSVQAVPLAAKLSPGHAIEPPVQVSATSHGPAAARHTVVDGAYPSGGQSAACPVQVSVASQAPADARQTVPRG